MLLLLPLIFPASVLFAVVSGFYCVVRYGRTSFESRLCLLSLVYLFLAYVSGFIAISFHPYWINNEAEEFIPLSERWSWAVVYSTAFEIVLCPLLLISYAILRSHNTRKLRSNSIPNTTLVTEPCAGATGPAPATKLPPSS